MHIVPNVPVKYYRNHIEESAVEHNLGVAVVLVTP